MLLDHTGREIVRRKQYGLTRGPHEYQLAEPTAQLVDYAGDELDVDAFGYLIPEADDDDELDGEEEETDFDSPRIA